MHFTKTPHNTNTWNIIWPNSEQKINQKFGTQIKLKQR
jgi:hypothetical protein